MAIRPADLQLAYIAAPQNAAVLGNAQNAPQVAQQAAQSAFAAQFEQREESVNEPGKAEGNRVSAREDHDPERDDGDGSPGQRRQGASREEPPEATGPLGLAGGGAHFIDVTA